MELEDASPSIRETARLARGDILVLTEKGKPAFALVGVKDELALEALLLSRSARFMGFLDRISEKARHQRTYTLAELKRSLGAPARPRGKPRRTRRTRRGA
jgi:antitoxin (DNA-binding transcriptional repressor) of toxin-antitoxin stability system